MHNLYGGNVIVYGSGYGGTLATWARKKFPHLINAAWSSSGIYELVVASLSMYSNKLATNKGLNVVLFNDTQTFMTVCRTVSIVLLVLNVEI